MRLAVSIGTAKPMPTLPVPAPPVSICELMPIDAPGGVEQRAARVAGVDRGVGLEHVVDREPVRGLDAALDGRDDAGRQRALQAEGVADRDRRIADLGRLAVAELQRVQVEPGGVHAQDGEVGRPVLPDDPRGRRLLVGELDRHPARALDDVLVREDRAVAVDDEARARGHPALLGGHAEVEGRRAALHDVGADVHDARRVALEDVARGQAAVAGVLGRAPQGGLLDDRGGRAAAEVEGGDGADGGAGAEDGGGEDERDGARERAHGGGEGDPGP